MYKCKSCGAGLIFNPKTQLLHCFYCNKDYNPQEVEDEMIKVASEEKVEKQENDNTYKAYIYKCTQCGAELITTDETISTFCSYCRGATMLERTETNKQKPSYVIPFLLTKEECIKAYKNHLRKSFLAPKYMTEEQEIDKIRGIYMPYWVYDFREEGTNVAKGKRYYRRRGDYVIYKDYDITTEIKAKYSGLTHDASGNFFDNLSEAIAPFSMKDRKDFTPAYLSGYYADSEDVNWKAYEVVTKSIAEKHASSKLAKKGIYARYSSKPRVTLFTKSAEIGLFPVYFLATKNPLGDRISYAVINGQTGKVAAEIPIDFKKYLIWTLIIAIPIFFLLNMFLTIKPKLLSVLAIIFGIISLVMSIFQNKKIKIREKRYDDIGFIKKEKVNIEKIKKQDILKKSYKPIIGIIISILVLVLKPVSDVYYYTTSIIAILLTIWSFSDIVRSINLLTTRKLPQFDKRGGD